MSDPASPVTVSVIIPLKNEQNNIPPLAGELEQALNSLEDSWECVWIDDGSDDESLDRLKELNQRDPRHRWLTFKENAGQSAGLCAGFAAARGAILATVDADRQNDPADLPVLIRMIREEGYDMVNGYRAKRQDSSARRLASKIGNGFRNLTTGKTVRDVGCSTRAFKRECVQHLPPFKGMHRFLPTIVATQGFSITEVPVNHRSREEGVSKYTNWQRGLVGFFDCFGMLWMRKRGFRYQIHEQT